VGSPHEVLGCQTTRKEDTHPMPSLHCLVLSDLPTTDFPSNITHIFSVLPEMHKDSNCPMSNIGV
jgi:hypothetical protein